MMAYGNLADLDDDNLVVGESQAILCVKRFVVAIVQVFGGEYLRAPDALNTARLLATNAASGFPGMLGSIDCMYCRCKNCPTAWHGYFEGHKQDSTIILEVVANQEWIWHGFFGMSGYCNDIDVLQRSPLFARLAKGETLAVQFVANSRIYNKGYYLVDGIYLKWATFVKPLVSPSDKKEQDAQPAAMKDVMWRENLRFCKPSLLL
jgi:hypothetical protein